jgi:hypothetical protein
MKSADIWQLSYTVCTRGFAEAALWTWDWAEKFVLYFYISKALVYGYENIHRDLQYYNQSECPLLPFRWVYFLISSGAVKPAESPLLPANVAPVPSSSSLVVTM